MKQRVTRKCPGDSLQITSLKSPFPWMPSSFPLWLRSSKNVSLTQSPYFIYIYSFSFLALILQKYGLSGSSKTSCTPAIFIVNIVYNPYPVFMFLLKECLVIKLIVRLPQKVRRDGLGLQNWDIIKGTFQNTSSMKYAHYHISSQYNQLWKCWKFVQVVGN